MYKITNMNNETSAEIELINESMPDMIMEADLFKHGEKNRFSRSKGGKFRCPICGRSLALYRSSGRWCINSFGHCSHFGYGGEYKNTAFGLYSALNGVDEKTAYRRLLGGWEMLGEEAEKKAREMRRRAEECRNEMSMTARKNIDSCRNDSSWGCRIAAEGRRLLGLRGIDIDMLPESIADDVGYISTEMLSSRGSGYHVEGIVFRVGESSFQIRRTTHGRYVRKNEGRENRFLSYGTGGCFSRGSLSVCDGSPLFVTEGPFDALSLYAAGASRVVALIGAANRTVLMEELKKVGPYPVAICMDDDETGESSASKLAEELGSMGFPAFVFPMNGGCHDVNDFLMKNRKGLCRRVSIATEISRRISSGRIGLPDVYGICDSLRKADKAGEETCFEEMI